MIKAKYIHKILYFSMILIVIFYYKNIAFAATPSDPSPFDGGDNVSEQLPAFITILKFLGTILVKWLSPLAGAYLIFKGCWAGAMSAEQHDKEGWYKKVGFGGCLIAIRVLITMFTTWLN